MAGLSDDDIIAIWSVTQSIAPAARGAALLRAVTPDASLDDLTRLPIGRRDARLLSLRDHWFGDVLIAVTSCPACGVRVEADIPTAALAVVTTEESENPFRMASGDYAIDVRMPDTRDLVAIADAADEDAARAMLLRRCIVQAATADGEIDPFRLPARILDDVVAAIAARDPGSDITIALTCPDCAHKWESALDIAAYLWKEIDTAALRLMRDVHELASAYGWSEPEILAIPPARRRIYRSMVSG